MASLVAGASPDPQAIAGSSLCHSSKVRQLGPCKHGSATGEPELCPRAEPPGEAEEAARAGVPLAVQGRAHAEQSRPAGGSLDLQACAEQRWRHSLPSQVSLASCRRLRESRPGRNPPYLESARKRVFSKRRLHRRGKSPKRSQHSGISPSEERLLPSFPWGPGGMSGWKRPGLGGGTCSVPTAVVN